MASPLNTAEEAALDVVRLNKTLRYEISQKGFFSQFIGESMKNPVSDQWVLSGSPIEHFNEFKNMGGSSMRLTMLRNMYGYGTDGRETLLGNEVEPGFFFATIYVHLKRNAVKQLDMVSAEITAWMKQALAYKPMLTRWGAAYSDADVLAALIEGNSMHITAAAPNGLAVPKNYLKNIWYADGGLVLQVAHVLPYVLATHKNSIIDDFKLIDTGMTTDTLQEARRLISQSNIQPYMYKGKKVWCIVINTIQEKQLKADSTFAPIFTGAIPRDMLDNPLLAQASYVYNNFYIYVNDVVARLPYYALSGEDGQTADTLDFFNYSAGTYYAPSTGMYEKVQTPVVTYQNVSCAVILGASAIASSTYHDWKFDTETVDYNMIKGLAISKYYGFSRLDYFDNALATSATVNGQAEPQCALLCTFNDQV